MDIDEFLDINKPLRKRIVRATNLVCQQQSNAHIESLPVRERVGNDFSKTLKAEFDAKLVDRLAKLAVSEPLTSQRSVEFETTSCDTENAPIRNANNNPTSDYLSIYKRYKFNVPPANPNLPIHAYRRSIMKKIHNSPVIIIKGETGCGKSTQVPQFILDEAYRTKEDCNIVVTQPRRIAAISLAEQVCRERGCDLNTLVGYQIGLDRQVSDDTKITYCTTGVLLQKLIQAKRMDMYSHIVLDEIHERDEDLEFLVIAIKRFMLSDPYQTKIILMSATIDVDEFATYFRLPCVDGQMLKAPTLDLKGERQHKIMTFYLDHLKELNFNIMLDYENPGISPKMYRAAVALITLFSSPQFAANGNCLLLFLPGINEIAEMYKTLEGERLRLISEGLPDTNWNILPLHSIISSKEQRNVFKRAPPGTVKIILATNIAESSITVPDVMCVIDFCLTRTLEVDPETGFSMLRLKWASKNSCDQRQGRTGRTSEGRCYRLVSKRFFYEQMSDNETPALIRCSLEKIVLKAKTLDSDVAPDKIIGLAIEPPDLTDIRYAILNLKETRGLHFNVGNHYSPDDGDLTFIGKVMEALPLDIRASRIIVMGYIFNVLDECIIMAAGITVQKVFTQNFKEPMKTYTQKSIFADGSGSDLIAIYFAYQYFIRKIQDNPMKHDDQRVREAERYCLDIKGLYEMFHLVHEINKRIEAFNLRSPDVVNRQVLKECEKNIILKICIAGAFYPNYYLRSSSISQEERERQTFHDLNGRDPSNTIYYRGIGTEEMGILYQDQVKNFLFTKGVIKAKDDVKVTFDDGAQKMYVTFLDKQDPKDANSKTEWLPGKIKTQIYKAIKLTRENERLRLKILEKSSMHQYAQRVGAGVYENNIFVPSTFNLKPHMLKLCCLPDTYVKDLMGSIVNVISPNKFWIKPFVNNNKRIMDKIQESLNRHELQPIKNLNNIIGKMVAIKISNDSQYYRGKVLSNPILENGIQKCMVFCIDIGEEHYVDTSKLMSVDDITVNERKLGLPKGSRIPMNEIPPRIFEATLSEVRPSYITSTSGKWTPEAIKRFKDLVENIVDFIEIYSVWNGVASVILKDDHGEIINQKLINEGHAQTCEECYPSKYDHGLRFSAQNFSIKQNNNELSPSQETTEYLTQFFYKPIPPPPEHLCTKMIMLKGPISPLETTLHSTMRSAYGKGLVIERLSVNSVLLDTDPQDPTDRLIVASAVGTSEKQNNLVLRNTTVMPNIHGFAALMAILFAPRVELHPDKSKSRYNSILCGLGYNPRTNVGYYEEHDVVLNLDCKLDNDDLIMINKLRYTMSSLLHTTVDENVPNLKPTDIVVLQKDLIYTLFKFLQKERQLIDVQIHSFTDQKWGAFEGEKMNEVDGTQIYGERAVFPSFSFLKLQQESEDDKTKYRMNNTELHLIAFCNGHIGGPEIKCLLCSKILTTAPEVRIHLFTKLHKDRAEQYEATFDVEEFLPERKQIDKRFNRSFSSIYTNDF